ncbi:MAG: DNA cytosine methyltransferase [Planctomycetes bacterium]|nr:DNA cytosine methyltransferase [Planctomycetota bacterium]
MSQAVTLFSGCGGCSLGLVRAGFSVSLAAELNEDACKTYRANVGEATLWQTDLGTVSPGDILQRVGAGVGEIPLMAGGPPCQGFSSAGAKDWTDPRNSLLKKFVDLVAGIRPVWFVMENVEGLLTSNDGFFITEAVTQFLKAGYWVRAKKIYMEKYGLPQRRKRVIVVGNLEGCEFDFPEETHDEPNTDSLFGTAAPLLSILDAIDDMGSPVESGEVTLTTSPRTDFQRAMRRSDDGPVTLHTIKKVNATTATRIRHLGQGKTMKDLPEELQHASFTRRAFRRVMDGTPTEKRGGAPSGMKRLVGATPSLTITSASPIEFVHPIEDRLLTLRECARIQSFPDSFAFTGSWSSVATQIGNAIPPAFMKVLAEHIASMAKWKSRKASMGRWFGIEATKASAMSPALERTLEGLREKTSAYLR